MSKEALGLGLLQSLSGMHFMFLGLMPSTTSMMLQIERAVP